MFDHVCNLCIHNTLRVTCLYTDNPIYHLQHNEEMKLYKQYKVKLFGKSKQNYKMIFRFEVTMQFALT